MALKFSNNNITALIFKNNNVPNDVYTLEFDNNVVWKRPYTLSLSSESASCSITRKNTLEPSAISTINTNIVSVKPANGTSSSANVTVYYEDTLTVKAKANAGYSIKTITYNDAFLYNGSTEAEITKDITIGTTASPSVVISMSVNKYNVTCKHLLNSDKKTVIGPDTSKTFDFGTSVSGSNFSTSITNSKKHTFAANSNNITVANNDNNVVYKYYNIINYTVTCHHRIKDSTTDFAETTLSKPYDSTVSPNDFTAEGSNHVAVSDTKTITVKDTGNNVYKYYYYKVCTVTINHRIDSEADYSSTYSVNTTHQITNDNSNKAKTFNTSSYDNKSSSFGTEFGTTWRVHSNNTATIDFKSSVISITKTYSDKYNVVCHHRIHNSTTDIATTNTRIRHKTKMTAANINSYFSDYDTTTYVCTSATGNDVAANDDNSVIKYYYYKNCIVSVTHKPNADCTGAFASNTVKHTVTYPNKLLASTYDISKTLGEGWRIVFYTDEKDHVIDYTKLSSTKSVEYSNKYTVTCKHVQSDDTTISVGTDTSAKYVYKTSVSGGSFGTNISNTARWQLSHNSTAVSVTGDTTVYKYYSVRYYTVTCKFYLTGTTTQVANDLSASVKYGTTITPAGYFSDPNGTLNTLKYTYSSSYPASLTVYNASTVYRYYTYTTYKVYCTSYIAGDGSISNQLLESKYDSKDVKYDDIASTSGSLFTTKTYSGYTFAWNGSPIGSNPKSSNDTFTVYKYYKINVNVELTWASYSNNTYYPASALDSDTYNVSFGAYQSTDIFVNGYTKCYDNVGNVQSKQVTSPMSITIYYRKYYGESSLYESAIHKYGGSKLRSIVLNFINVSSQTVTIGTVSGYIGFVNGYSYRTYNSSGSSISYYKKVNSNVYQFHLNTACGGYNTYYYDLFDNLTQATNSSRS